MNNQSTSRRKNKLFASLYVKLALAFAVVSIMPMVLNALYIGLRARTEFDRSIHLVGAIRLAGEPDVEARLADYYTAHRGWKGVDQVFTTLPPPPKWFLPMTLVDSGYNVVYGTGPYPVGMELQSANLTDARPIAVNGQTVGWLMVEPMTYTRDAPTLQSDFSTRLTQAIAFSLLTTVGLAVVIGAALARTLSRPLHALTQATRRVAQGELGFQVKVHGRDELGDLAASFNQMSADLAQANHLRRQMTADIAHELRSPLSVILGYTEALSDDKLMPSTEVFNSLYLEAKYLQRLVEDLRTLSLADAGELALTRGSISPQLLLERAAVAYGSQASQGGVTLRVDAPPGLADINVDPDRMAQVLGNLINNALRYSSRGDEIVLSAEQTEAGTTLRVHDRGTGISEADLPHIFDRFYRGDASRHTDNGESGLGLAIAKSIVEAHSGAIQVESTPGKGATFSILLPSQEPQK